MSLLAGFDIVTEIYNSTILKMIKSCVTIGGVPLNPSFEMTLPFAGGIGHMIVDNLLIDLNDDDSITLNFIFLKSSATIEGQLSKSISPLSGSILINVPILLSKTATVNAGESIYQVSIDMVRAKATTAFDSETNREIKADLAGVGIDLASFVRLVDQAITDYVRKESDTILPMTFLVRPDMNGSLSPRRFTSLQVHCIGNSKRSKQALGLFGNLLVSSKNNGNHLDKTTTAILPGQDVAISLSASAFHSLVFCPAVASSFNTSLDALPPTCGGSGGMEVSGVKLTSLAESFGNDQINIAGQIYDSGVCYELNGSISGSIKLAIIGSDLIPEINLNEPDVDIDIPWYCYLAVGVILGPISAVVLGAIDLVVDIVADALAGNALSDALNLEKEDLNGFGDGTLESVTITPECLVFQGRIPIYPPPSTSRPSLEIEGSVTTSEKIEISRGIWRTKVWCKAEDEEEKDYPYVEYAQKQVSTNQLSSEMLGTPLSATYKIRYRDVQSVSLTGSTGSVTIPDVECTYHSPLYSGTKVVQPVHLDYDIKDTIVRLRNRPEEGTFSITLQATVLDCTGEPPTSVNHKPEESILFRGNSVEMGGDYAKDIEECFIKLSNEMKKHFSEKYMRKWGMTPHWVKVNYPKEQQITQYLRFVKEFRKKNASEILMHFRLLHSSSFDRAYHASSSKQLGKDLKAIKKEVGLRRTEVMLKRQIAMKTAQMDGVRLVMSSKMMSLKRKKAI